MVEVPGTEPDWEPAEACQGRKRNPALQGSLWEYAVGGFRLVAGLGPSLGSLAARLRLHPERSWEDGLGELDAAMFSIRKIHFALSQTEGHPVKVWVSRDQTDVDAALDVLLEALGIGRDALAYYLGLETRIFVHRRADPEV